MRISPGRTPPAARPLPAEERLKGTGRIDRPLGLVQRAHLAGVAAQLKVSHDLVAVLAARYATLPGELVTAQTRQAATIQALLDRYGVTDPHAGYGAGRFADAHTQQQYDRALQRGSASRAAASDVVSQSLGETIAMIESALPGLTAPDVRQCLLGLYAEVLRQSRLLCARTAQDRPASQRR